MLYFVEFWAGIERRQMGSRDQTEDGGNQKVDAKGHEPSAPPEEGVLMREDQEDDCRDSRNHTGEHSRRGDAFPVKAQTWNPANP
jgi:hypothetical protein